MFESESPPQAQAQAEAEAEAEAQTPVLANTSWILARPPEHYTIQVIALSTREKIEALIAGHEAWAPFAMYTVERDSGTLFVLVQGDYPSKEAAREARDAFPQTIQDTEALWIRQFDRVQSLIGN